MCAGYSRPAKTTGYKAGKIMDRWLGGWMDGWVFFSCGAEVACRAAVSLWVIHFANHRHDTK